MKFGCNSSCEVKSQLLCSDRELCAKLIKITSENINLTSALKTFSQKKDFASPLT